MHAIANWPAFKLYFLKGVYSRGMIALGLIALAASFFSWTGEKRLPMFPDTPSISETFPGYHVSTWMGLFVPTAVPAPVVERLRADVRRVMSAPELRERLSTASSLDIYNASAEALLDAFRRSHGKTTLVVAHNPGVAELMQALAARAGECAGAIASEGVPTCALAIFDLDGTLADSFPWFVCVLNGVADQFRFRRVAEHEIGDLRRVQIVRRSET